MRTSVRIYDSTISLVAETDEFESLVFSRSFYEPGQFELKINANLAYAEEFIRGRFIVLTGSTGRAGIITDVTRQIGQDGKGSQIVTVKGSEVSTILDRRFVVPASGQSHFTLTDEAETVVKAMINLQMGSGATASRQVSLLQIATDQGRGLVYTAKERFSNLLEAVVQALIAGGIGFNFSLDTVNKKIVVDFNTGSDRTKSTGSQPAIFSTGWDTLKSAKIQDTEISYKNLAIVAGQGEGSDRSVVDVFIGNEPTGIDRRELFVDARDLTTGLDKRGEQRLEGYNVERYFDAEILESSPLVLGVNYDLGDIVTIEAYNESTDARITSVQEGWTSQGYAIRVVFDRGAPTIQSQIKSGFATVQRTTQNVEIPQELRPASSPVFANLTITTLLTAPTINAPTTLQLQTGGVTKATLTSTGLKTIGILTVDGFGDPTGKYITLRDGFDPASAGGVGLKANDHVGGNFDGMAIFGFDGISFFTSATERARLNDTGNLGINKTNPLERLDVHGGIRTTSNVADFFSANGLNIDFIPGINTGRIQVATTLPGAGALSLQASGGNVLIGTTTDAGYKLQVVGDANITGTLSKGSGSFKIDHPLKPGTHYLVHSFIEGPKADLIYRGTAQLVNGVAVVDIDESAGMTKGTFEALCREVQVFTSNETCWTPIRGKVEGSTLTIEAQDLACGDKVSWMVIGERKDPHMMATEWTDENGRVIVEPEKVKKPVEELENEPV